jgi:hypothetical protein
VTGPASGAAVLERDPARPPGSSRRGTDLVALAPAYRGGASIRECAAAFGITGSTAGRLLAAAGVPRRRPAVPARPSTRTRSPGRAGTTIAECAAAFGIGPGTTRRLLEAARVPRRPPGPRRADADPAALARMYQEGASIRECADAHHISAGTARKLLDAAEVTRRRAAADPATLIAAYQRGGSITACAAAHGTGTKAAGESCATRGDPADRPSPPPPRRRPVGPGTAWARPADRRRVRPPAPGRPAWPGPHGTARARRHGCHHGVPRR